MVLLSTLGLMSSGDIAYKVFVGVADAALYYLPVMVAFTTATKFNCNKLVSALAAAMIHPSVSALLATEGGAYFLGIKLQNIAYGGQVFPAILTVIFMSFIEKWANKWCPKAIRVFFVPMLCFGIGFPVALVVLGPLGYNIGTLLTTVILALYNTLGWLAVALLAAVLPFMISMGMHKALVPYGVAAISDPGFEMLYLPASLAHNISEEMPLALATKYNGWVDRRVIDCFAKFCHACFERYKDQVKYWLTFNEVDWLPRPRRWKTSSTPMCMSGASIPA